MAPTTPVWASPPPRQATPQRAPIAQAARTGPSAKRDELPLKQCLLIASDGQDRSTTMRQALQDRPSPDFGLNWGRIGSRRPWADATPKVSSRRQLKLHANRGVSGRAIGWVTSR